MQEGGSSADEDEHHDGDVDHGIIEDESIHVFEGHSGTQITAPVTAFSILPPCND